MDLPGRTSAMARQTLILFRDLAFLDDHLTYIGHEINKDKNCNEVNNCNHTFDTFAFYDSLQYPQA